MNCLRNDGVSLEALAIIKACRLVKVAMETASKIIPSFQSSTTGVIDEVWRKAVEVVICSSRLSDPCNRAQRRQLQPRWQVCRQPTKKTDGKIDSPLAVCEVLVESRPPSVKMMKLLHSLRQKPPLRTNPPVNKTV